MRPKEARQFVQGQHVANFTQCGGPRLNPIPSIQAFCYKP